MVVIYGSARTPENHPYYASARQLAYKISYMSQADDLGLCVMTGGGPGIMEAANRGAFEAQAPSIGVCMGLPHERNSNEYLTPELTFHFEDLPSRKAQFFKQTQAFVAFPGGLGTLDEMFETMTLIQNGIIPTVPVILYGRAFWQQVLNMQLLVDENMVDADELAMVHTVDSVDEAWDVLQQVLQPL